MAVFLLPRSEHELHQLQHRVVELVHHPLLERDDGVVRDRDVFRADLRAALRDVAVADAVLLLQVRHAVRGVERVHLQLRDVDEEPRADELVVLVVVAQDVAHVLAQEALDALAELLHAVGVLLLHPPGAVGVVRLPRLERLDLLLHLVVPRHVGDEVLDAAGTPASARR